MFISFVERFEAQLSKNPLNNAIVSPYEKLSFNYQQLNSYANKIERHLRSLGITKDDVIGFSSNRAINSYLILLGLLKLGAVIVPLDQDYPTELLEYIIKDSKMSCIVSNTEFSKQISSDVNILNLETFLQNLDNCCLDEHDLKIKIDPENLIYLIYTSGSTGKPKGICMSQGAVSAFLNWEMNYYDHHNNEKVLQFSPLNFDIFFQECLTTWSTGGQLVILPKQYRNQPAELLRFITDVQINKIILPYVVFVQLAQIANAHNLFPSSLKVLISTGEALIATPSINILIKNLIGCKFYNLYGASENQIVSIYQLKFDEACKAVPIGKPIPDSKVFILDENKNIVQQGEVGSLYVASELLCSGYLNNKDLTTERFIPNPFQTHEEKRFAKNATLYKTGDVIRYLPDGNLEYIGRDDFQIKIRGHRVELGEIEAALLNYHGIKQSVVVAKGYKASIEEYTSNKYLAGYYVAETKIDENDLISFLATQLPAIMVPNVLISLPNLPLTVNGKVDRKALPEPEFTSDSVYVAPRNELERKICQIWAKAFALAEDKVGINDAFFRLGGNSILAISVLNELNAQFNVQISIADFLRSSTIKNLAHLIKNYHTETVKPTSVSVSQLEQQRLSFAQERLWFIEKYEGGSSVYNELMTFQLAENIKLDLLALSINDILSRHEILRTVIKESEQGTNYQQVLSLTTHPFKCHLIKINNIVELDEYLANEANYVYDLSTEFPIRVCFYQIKNTIETKNYLNIMFHHIAFDGWSIGVFLKELQRFYKIHLNNNSALAEQINLSPLAIQYKEFALWQRNYLSGENLEQQLTYWRKKLSDFEPLNLMTDYRRQSTIDYRGAHINFELSKQTSVQLRNLAKKLKVSLYSLLLSGYYLLLRIYSNQNDIILGILTANRHYSEIENLIGFFVNSLPLRMNINSNATIKQFIENISTEVIEAQLHQDLPFEKMVAELDIQKDTSRHPIFQVLFEFQDFDDELDETILHNYHPKKTLPIKAKFDLNTVIYDSKTQLSGCFNYATSLYSPQTIQGYIETYIYILEQFSELANDEQSLIHTKISDLNYLNSIRYEQVVRTWNKTDADYPVDTSLAELFEHQVEKTPNNIAVVADEISLTYSELNARVNQLANYMRQNYPIKPDTIVMLVLDRDIQFLTFMLAVFKAGIAYVPIDPAMPQDRIQSILTESQPLFIATETKYADLIAKLDNPSGQVCYYEALALDKYSKENLTLEISPYSLAYVIYTSGSTGRPKGAMVEYRGMINHLFIKVTDMYMTESDKVAQTATQIFDVSVWQFISALMVGGTTVVFKDTAAWDPDKLLEIMTKEQVTIFQTVPSHMYAILPRIENDADESSKLCSLNWLIINGEPLSSEICDRWFKLHPTIPIINAYGPTECSDDVTHFKIFTESNETIPKIMPISGTLGNTQIYITDEYLNPVPIGAIGEIVIGGVGVGRGYLNRPELTAEKFVLNPFATAVIALNNRPPRLYRTGDLARYLHDGRIEYISRKDFQVKIRGYRIELGEVESALMTYTEITQAVALVYKHKEASEGAYLVAYYVAETILDEDAIYRHLRSLLPEYMVPAVLVYLSALPLTMNGKLDRKALPEPKMTGATHYVAPRSAAEQAVCTIWAEVLGLAADKVSIEDDFFRLGGDSIVSIQLVSRLRQRLHAIVSVKDIFTYRTIARLYEAVLSKVDDENKKILIKTEQGQLNGDLDLLPVQEWFFSLTLPAAQHWNQSFLIKVPLLDIERLKVSLVELFHYHDAFRLRYKQLNNKCYQQYYVTDAMPVSLQVLDVSKLSQAEIYETLTTWQSDFSLQEGPLYSVGYLYGYADGSARIYFALHHLIVDTVSWRILVQDLQELYAGKSLTAKGSSYRQWVNAVKTYKIMHTNEIGYWKEILSDYKVNHSLPTNSTAQQISFSLDKQATQQLLTVSSHAYHTQINDLLLTALAMTLATVTGNKVNHIVLEGHGREEIDASIDIARTLGWFTTLYPVRLQTQANIGSSIKHIKEMLRAIPTRGLGYGAVIGYGKENLALPQILFNYQGQFDQTMAHNEWSISAEPSGLYVAAENPKHYLLVLDGWVLGGELHFDINSRWDVKTTRQLTDHFKQYLLAVIKHTVTLTRSYLTASDINYVISQSYLDKLQAQHEISQVYLANNLQQGFIYHALSQGEVDDAYLVQMLWRYTKEINQQHLYAAWQFAQAKYSALRLRFAWDETLIQSIDKTGQLDWRYIDLSVETNQQLRKQKIEAIKIADRQERYDLSRSPLFRVYLIKEEDNLYHCLFSMHHAMLDGWSCPLLLNYIHDTYKKLQVGHTVETILDSSYERAQAYLQGKQKIDQEYWHTYVATIEERTDLQGLLSHTARDQGIILSEYKHIKEPCSVSLTINGDLYKQLKLLSQQEGVTLNAIMQYTWHKLLHVYGHSQQTVVGTTISGRNLPIDDIEFSVGLYINTLPLKFDHNNDNATLQDGIKVIQASINELHSRSNINLASLQQGGARLFDSLFIYENYPTPEGEANDSLGFVMEDSVEKLDYPLGVLVNEEGNEVQFKLQYAAELFNRETVNNVLLLVEHLLKQIADKPTQQATKLTYLTPLHAQQILYAWNNTAKSYPHDKTLIQLFEEQVKKTPNNIAMVYEDIKLNYKQLNQRANQLAHYLASHNGKNENNFVCLCLERNEHMLIGLLAILKMGKAYVPIDSSYPEERIRYILSDTNAALILINEQHKSKFDVICNSEQLVSIDNEALQQLLTTESSADLVVQTSNTDLAYVIYTSGTTGKPKGVMITHESVVNLKFDLTEKYKLVDENILLFANYVFDASVEQIVLALLNGHKLVVINNDTLLDEDKFYAYLNQHQVTHVHVPPAILARYDFNRITHLKRLISGGDRLSKEICNKLRAIGQHVTVINEYGPTETTITSTVNFVTEQNVSIGKPIANTTAYVLDAQRNPVPVGAIGELYLGGIGLARGYLNQPELTQQSFVPNPFQSETEKANKNTVTQARLYRTGDFVRWQEDGTLAYIGRKDFQVKVRGYRIELGEIETALLSYPGITQAVVIARKQSEAASEKQSLVGYYVASTPLVQTAIEQHLRAVLPDYMVPSVWVALEALPLTLNGKLDRKALPEPQVTQNQSAVAPRSELEQQVCAIWAEVLGLPPAQVGIDADFFRLGGDSIISIQLVSRLRQRLGLSVSVKDIFSCRTIAKLYDTVLSKADLVLTAPAVQTEAGQLSGEVELLPIQAWFFAQDLMLPNYWNQAFLIKTPALEIEKLHASLWQLVEQHDALRMCYQLMQEGQLPIQSYSESVVMPKLTVLDIRQLAAAEGSEAFTVELQAIFSAWQSHFHLETGPLYHFGYITGYADGSARIYMAAHHLVIDTVSWRILTEDLQALYEGRMLGNKGSSYRQWVNTVNNYKKTHSAEVNYWQQVLADYQESALSSKEIKQTKASQLREFSLSQSLTMQLLKESGYIYNTQINDLLLTALGLSLAKLTGHSINHIVLEGHGREELATSMDISRTVGWFTTLYPVRLAVSAELGGSIKSIKETLRQIPNKGIGYGAVIGYGPDSPTLPRISFNYLGQFDSAEPATKSWAISSEASGITVASDNRDPMVVAINGWVIDGSLKFQITSQLAAEDTMQLAQTFEQYLKAVIAHTVNQPRRYLTPSDVDYVVSESYLDRLQATQAVSGVYLANSLQQGFIYHALNQGEVDDAYLVQMGWDYQSAINEQVLHQAWRYAQAKFASLRLRFAWEEALVQVIDEVSPLDWRYIDLSAETNQKIRQQKIAAIQHADRQERYPLNRSPLWRIYLIKQADTLYHCLFSLHHAILDGWGSPLLLNYVHETYQQLSAGQVVTSVIDNTYERAQTYLQTHREANVGYWQTYINAIEEYPDLSGLVKSDQAIRLNDYRYIKESCEQPLMITGNLYSQLKALSQREGITLNAILQYVWHKLLQVYGHSQQTVVGTVVSGRQLPIDGIEKSVGLYINTLPLKVEHQEGNQSVLAAIQTLQTTLNEISCRSQVNLASLQSGRTRLFDSLFIYENYPSNDSEVNNALGIVWQESIEKLDYPLSVLAREKEGELEFKLQYAGELFSKLTIGSLLAFVEHILQQIAKAPQQKTQELNYLTHAQYQQIIHAWNATEQDYPHAKTIAQLFEEQAEKTPDNIAVVYGTLALTYRMLNAQANQLAHYLRNHYAIAPDTLIALCLERNEYLVIAILAVLKAGGAYVPIDPNYPEERIRYMLEDTYTPVVLTNKAYSLSLEKICVNFTQKSPQILVVNDEFCHEESFTNPINSITNQNLAYVIYTSGTTGKPKGVMLSHSAYISVVASIRQLYLNDKENIHTFSITNYVFDIWGLEYGLPLLSGGSITLGNNDFDSLDCHAYDFVQITPSLLDLKVTNFLNTTNCLLFVGGEKLNLALLNQALRIFPSIVNLYGPTETTIWSASKLYRAETKAGISTVSIGKALSNEKLYILDNKLNPLPLGAVGELYIGGDGLARGYLNNSSLTHERFISNPFQTNEEKRLEKNNKLYKTGDFVRWLDDGTIEYVGRSDFQVKIRGHRVELAEIESVLTSYDAIHQSIVLIGSHAETNNQYLVGYYVSDYPLEETALFNYLHSQLPEYMIPNVFVHMHEFPLTINGKLDQKALPVPKFIEAEQFVAPRNLLESQICAVWAEILNLPFNKIGIYDDFFRLGGNSILAISLIVKLNNNFAAQLKVADIFAYRNIDLLNQRISQVKANYNVIIKLNRIYTKPNLFLIHPGAAGCEVYSSLANRLANEFSCYGVDSYNLYHQQKLANLQELADYYLLQIDKIMKETNQKEYHLLGWSLGGLIALEIACKLENKGIAHIKVYLLDTIINDDNLTNLKNNFDIKQAKIEYVKDATVKGYDSSYVEKVLSNMDTDINLTKQYISAKLKNTHILLFKAMLEEQAKETKDISRYAVNLTYNNIDKFIANQLNIKLVKAKLASHNNILNQEELLYSEIINFNKERGKEQWNQQQKQEVLL